ncbi:MAG: glycosyltransferase [Verrucomicrobiota bacterium]
MRVSMNVKPVGGAWGGQNQFVQQFIEVLKQGGHEVTFSLDRHVTHILLLSVYDYETVTYLPKEVAAFKRKRPQVKVLHRVNDNDERKGTSNVDPAMIEANASADMTVYISSWLRKYFIQKGMDALEPSCVIHNAVDDTVFHPDDAQPSDDRFWLVTHHWSDNWMKGFHEYLEIDRMIAEGELEGVGLRVIGNWPQEIEWRAAQTHAPVQGPALAEQLKQCHLYVTASRWEPGGMHFIEGLQCGLPVLYHADGGGINEVAAPFGLEFRDNLKEQLLQAKAQMETLRQKLVMSEIRPSGMRMVREYYRVLCEM